MRHLKFSAPSFRNQFLNSISFWTTFLKKNIDINFTQCFRNQLELFQESIDLFFFQICFRNQFISFVIFCFKIIFFMNFRTFVLFCFVLFRLFYSSKRQTFENSVTTGGARVVCQSGKEIRQNWKCIVMNLICVILNGAV